jgi:hypothetical protein
VRARPRDLDADRRSGGPWRPVTRRAFVSALGAAAAALAVRRATRGIAQDDPQGDDDRPPTRWTGTTRWIGHC